MATISCPSQNHASIPKNFFHCYDQRTNQEKLSFWQHVTSCLEGAPDAVVSCDATGKIVVDAWTPWVDPRNHSLTPQNNPLLTALRNPGQSIEYDNKHFAVIKSLRHTAEKPRLLILPKPKPNPKDNYEDLRDFLSQNRATDEEKISLLDCMQELLKLIPSRENRPDLFHANVGRRYEIPYLHIHYIPS